MLTVYTKLYFAVVNDTLYIILRFVYLAVKRCNLKVKVKLLFSALGAGITNVDER